MTIPEIRAKTGAAGTHLQIRPAHKTDERGHCERTPTAMSTGEFDAVGEQTSHPHPAQTQCREVAD